MKQKHMIIKTIIITINVLFIIYLFMTYPNFAEAQQGNVRGALMVLRESSALDTNLLAKYVATNFFCSDPLVVLHEQRDVVITILNMFILPALFLLLINTVIIAVCWKRKPMTDGNDRNIVR